MPIELRRHKYASLDTVVAQSGPSPTIPVILCHGYGAGGSDLVSLAEPLTDWLEEASEQFQFVFPAAPLSPPELAMYGGRAWWEINMSKLLAASQSGSFEELHDIEPPGIERATTLLAACVNEVLQKLGTTGPYVLGGFSQGAMVAMNAALRSNLPQPDLLIQFSGTVVCRPHWKAALAAGQLSKCSVLQSHGRQDAILPFSSAEVLSDLLEEANVDHQFIAFNGPHTIPMDALMQLAVKLKQLAVQPD